MTSKSPRRRRNGPALSPPEVALYQGKSVGLDTYESAMTQRLKDIARDFITDCEQLDRYVDLAMCGRVLGVNGHNIAERTWYCQMPTDCPACRCRDANHRAAHFIQDHFRQGVTHFLHLSLTLGNPSTQEEVKSQFQFVADVRPKLTKLLSGLKQTGEITSYLSGLHAQKRTNSEYLSPHFHVAFTSTSTSANAVATSRIQNFWERKTREGFGTKYWTAKSHFGTKITSKTERGKTIARDHVERTLAYIQRPYDGIDQAERKTIQRLLKDAGIARTFWASQSIDGNRRAKQRSTFHARRLGKCYVIALPSGGSYYRAECAEVEAVELELRNGIRQHLLVIASGEEN